MIHKGPIYRSSNELERLLRVWGVPPHYVSSDYKDIGKTFSFTVDREWDDDKGKVLQVGVKRQEETIDLIFKDTGLRDTSEVVGVGSYPSDHLGLTFGAAVCRRAHSFKLKIAMINMRRNPDEEFASKLDVAVLYNIPRDCHNTRVGVVRDWMSYLKDTFTVVIIAGGEPVSFFLHRMHYHLKSAIYFRGEDGQNRIRRI